MGCLPRTFLVFLLTLLLSLGLWTGVASPIDNAPCTAFADRADVAVRVGPGVNRAVRLFLPLGESFAVTGQASAEGGSAWWQIALAGVEQAWVAQAEVMATGACASVSMVDAPPVVRPPRDDSGQDSPATEEPTDESSPSGSWGACGSCDSCGHPSNECLLSPDGQCLWDPAQCAPGGDGGANGAPPPDDVIGPDT